MATSVLVRLGITWLAASFASAQMPAGGGSATDEATHASASTLRQNCGGSPPSSSLLSVLHDNGGFITQTGVGLGGADVSEVESGFSVFGYSAQSVNNWSLADDFTVPAGQTWDLSDMHWFSYQTNSSTIPTITAAAVRLWSGSPLSSGVILAGDTTTNRITSTTFTGSYRVMATSLTNNQRPVMDVGIDLSFLPALPSGTYWIEVSLSGSLPSGPWCVPTVPALTTDNALQRTIGAWAPVLDTASQRPQDFPFKLHGTPVGVTTAFGLQHTPLGSATLNYNANTQELAIGAIGSSGNDGVAIALGQADGSCVMFQDIDPGGVLPIGSYLRVQSDGQLGGGASVQLSSLKAESTPNGIAYTIDLSGLGNPGCVVEAYLADQLAGSVAIGGGGGQVIASAVSWPKWLEGRKKRENRRLLGCRPLSIAAGGNPPFSDTGDLWIGLGPASSPGSGATMVTLHGGAVVFADLLRVVPLSAPGMSVDYVESMSIRAAGLVSGFTLVGGLPYVFGQPHTALGSAVLDVSPSQVRLTSNVSGALYGARVEFLAQPHFELGWSPLDVGGGAPTNARLILDATGVVNGQCGLFLGSTQVRKLASELEITADFSSLGSSTHRIEVWLLGSQVGLVTGHTGVVASIPSLNWPTRASKLGSIGGGTTTCFAMDWPAGETISVPGAGSFFGDQIRILAETPTMPSVLIDTFRLQAQSLPELTIMDESFGASPISTYCTAGTSTNGCSALVSASGTASAAATSGFNITVSGVEGQRAGLLFYGVNGRLSSPWGLSFLCVKAPTQRMATQNSGGTNGQCDGLFATDWLAFMAAHPGALGTPLAAGAVFNAQAWYRDPPAPKSTNLSDALEFTLIP